MKSILILISLISIFKGLSIMETEKKLLKNSTCLKDLSNLAQTIISLVKNIISGNFSNLLPLLQNLVTGFMTAYNGCIKNSFIGLVESKMECVVVHFKNIITKFISIITDFISGKSNQINSHIQNIENEFASILKC